MKKLILVNIITLVILVGIGVGGYYYFDQVTSYIKTDNATVQGQQVVIAAPTSGKLTSWNGEFGKTFNANTEVGKVSVTQGTQVQEVPVVVPKDATVVETVAVSNQLVAAGTPLAYGYDMNNLWVVANLKESIIQDVKPGQDVDVYVDAYPNNNLTGKVQNVGLTTANVFSLLPSGSGNANFTKVEQVIPVTISLDQNKGLELVPGMSVSVRIHK